MSKDGGRADALYLAPHISNAPTTQQQTHAVSLTMAAPTLFPSRHPARRFGDAFWCPTNRATPANQYSSDEVFILKSPVRVPWGSVHQDVNSISPSPTRVPRSGWLGRLTQTSIWVTLSVWA